MAVYFIQDSLTLNIKIGFTDGDPQKRLKSLQTASQGDLVLLTSVPGTSSLEKTLHRRFAASHVRGEWFRPTHDLITYIARLTTPAFSYDCTDLAFRWDHFLDLIGASYRLLRPSDGFPAEPDFWLDMLITARRHPGAGFWLKVAPLPSLSAKLAADMADLVTTTGHNAVLLAGNPAAGEFCYYKWAIQRATGHISFFSSPYQPFWPYHCCYLLEACRDWKPAIELEDAFARLDAIDLRFPRVKDVEPLAAYCF